MVRMTRQTNLQRPGHGREPRPITYQLATARSCSEASITSWRPLGNACAPRARQCAGWAPQAGEARCSRCDPNPIPNLDPKPKPKPKPKPTNLPAQVFVNKARVRLLTTPVGMWSKARDFYTRWEALPGVNALARRFPLAGAKSGASVIVFKSAPPRSQRRPATGWEGVGVSGSGEAGGAKGVRGGWSAAFPGVVPPRGTPTNHAYPPSHMRTH